VQGLHAQAKPRAYAVIEIDVRNQEGFTKEFIPLIGKTITDQGGKYLARGGKIVGVAGRTPKRLTVVEFESLEKAQAAFASAAYKDARKIGNKYSGSSWNRVGDFGVENPTKLGIARRFCILARAGIRHE